MRPQLLDVLAEPGTGARLRLDDARHEGDRIVSGRLVSEKTGRAFEIVRGIPRFVGKHAYTDSFGMQWNRFKDVQVDSRSGGSHSRQRFDAELGWTQADLEGKWLLDAGCGAGRFAEIAAARGPNLVALDLSSAVDAAADTLARFPCADIVQGSLLEPPFRPGVFDFAYCIGVAQHTPDPPGVLAQILSCIRAGGRFGFTIYARRPWTKLYAKYLLRPITRRLPAKVLLGAIEGAMPLLFPVTDKLFRIPVVGRVARFAIPVANYVERVDVDRRWRYEEAILDTFDMLSPRYDSPMIWEEVEAVLKQAGAASWDFTSRVPITVVGER